VTPFGRVAVYKKTRGSCLRGLILLLWSPFGATMFLMHALLGLIYCVSLIFIPFGLQHFALAVYCWYPFESTVERRTVNFRDIWTPSYFV